MNKHGKKIAGAVISAGVIILYYVFFFGIIMSEVESPVVKILLGAGPALIAAALIFVLIQRIKEIKGGEEDDLGKY